MDARDTLRNLLISAAVFVFVLWLWPALLPLPAPRSAPQDPAQPVETVGATADSSATTTNPDTKNVEGKLPAQAGVGTAPSSSNSGQGPFRPVEAPAEKVISIGSEETNGVGTQARRSPYRMRLDLSNVGASIASATLTDHAEQLGSEKRYTLLSVVERDDGRRLRSLAIENLNIDGVDVALHDRRWQFGKVEPYETTAEQGQRVDFWVEIQREGQPALKLTRTFQLPRQETKLGRHDLRSTLTVENASAEPHQVIMAFRGALGLRPNSASGADDRHIDVGKYDGTRVIGLRKPYSTVGAAPGQSLSLYAPSRTEPAARLSWAATANTYFTTTIAPLNRDGTDNASHLADVSAADLDGLPVTTDDVTVRFVTRAESLAPGESLSYPAEIYLGEKDGHAFRELEPYARRNYYYQISQGFGWCTFSFLVELMIWLLDSLFFLARDYGLAIIVLVLIVRAMLHPITKKGQVNMVRMQQKMGEFAPKLEDLKKKYANDKARLQQETMKLYRDHGINPGTQLLTCLPMVLQMPIWLALFLSLSNNVQLRHQPFHFTWVQDLTAPDALFRLSSPWVIPVLGWHIASLNLLPVLVAVFMYIQQKTQPKPKPNPNLSEQQRQQQEMMQKMGPIMSVMMLIFFYNMPSGLNLYIMFSSLFGALEQYVIRKHIKEREAAGTLAGSAGPTETTPVPVRSRPRRLSFLQRLLEKLQRMAEEAQKSRPRRAARGKPRRCRPA